MKKKVVAKVVSGLVVLGVLGGAGWYGYDVYTEMQNEKTELKNNLDEAQNQIKKEVQEKSKVKEDLDTTKKSLDSTKKSLQKEKKEKETKKKEVKKLKDKVTDLENQLAAKLEAQQVAMAEEVEYSEPETMIEEAYSEPAVTQTSSNYSNSGGGHLTASAGVFEGPSGHETYYSQRV